MLSQILDIHVDYARAELEGTGAPKLHTYILDNWSDQEPAELRPAVVICPGGGYAMTSNREAEPIAARFCSLGYHCFVLRYTVAPMRFPGALLELSASVALVREHAAEWRIDPDRIYVCGFSAGGHLACSLGMFWNRDFVTEPLNLRGQENKPNGMILGYPVISSGEFAHHESFHCLLQDHYEEQCELVSLEKRVSRDTPPAFLWHTVEDSGVPVENSLLLASALRAADIPFEMHLYQHGCHGLSLANELTGWVEPSCQTWVDLADKWIRSL